MRFGALLLVIACSSAAPPGDDDTGVDDTPTADVPVAYAQACEDVGMAGCLRALTCNLTFTDEDLCTSGFVRSCCEEEGTCDDAVPADERALWADCAADLAVADCDTFESTLPAACTALGVDPR